MSFVKSLIKVAKPGDVSSSEARDLLLNLQNFRGEPSLADKIRHAAKNSEVNRGYTKSKDTFSNIRKYHAMNALRALGAKKI